MTPAQILALVERARYFERRSKTGVGAASPGTALDLARLANMRRTG